MHRAIYVALNAGQVAILNSDRLTMGIRIRSEYAILAHFGNGSVLSRAVDLERNQGDVILGAAFACPGLDGPQHPPDSVTQRIG